MGIATVPSRESFLLRVVESVRHQVDELFVALNGYDSIPQSLRNLRNVKCEILDNMHGDSAKFMHVAEVDGIYFSVDDDLIYPHNYCDYLQFKVEQYNSIVSLHGRVYKRPVTSFRRGFSLNYHCLHSYTSDVRLDLGGTGVMAFDTQRLKLTLDDFPVKNMADVHVAKQAYLQGVPIMGIAHQRDYLTYLSPRDTIWQNSRDDSVQTKILQSFLK